MKAIGFVFLALALAGCANKQSRFASDPRAAVVGPAYLEYIEQYPRDRDTAFYFPLFTIRGFNDGALASTVTPGPDISPSIAGLLIERPEPSQSVKDITGKGYPSLEQVGLRLFTAPPN